MKNPWLFCSFLCLNVFTATTLSAQPGWTQETIRNQQFPASTYLTGFSVAKNTQNEAGDEFMNKQVEVARTELINSIYTNLQSLSSLNIENKNTQTNEVYRLKTASFSKASISGLKVEKYYDAANLTAYAFAFAKKAEVIDYNKRLITEAKEKTQELIERAQSFEASNNNQQALKTYYEALTLLRSVETAQSVLLALKIDLSELPFRNTFNQHVLSVNQGIERLQRSQSLTLNDVCYALAYGLFLQIGALDQPMAMTPLTYENSGFESPFSKQLQAQLEKQLVNVGQYNIQRESSAAENLPTVKGSYWKEADGVHIIVLLEDGPSANMVASAEGRLPWQQINDPENTFIPAVLKKAEILRNIRLKALNPRLEAKANEMQDHPARVQLTAADFPGQLNDIPMIFTRPSGEEILARARTDEQGMATAVLQNMAPSSRIQFVDALIDIIAYLQPAEEHPGYQRLIKSLPQEKVRFMVKINGLTVHLETAENDANGAPLPNPILGPKIKSILGKSGHQFTDDFSEADWHIRIDARSRNGNSIGALFFSYVDATISVVDLKNGRELYGNTFENVKGGGGSFEQASLKAFQTISETIANDLSNAMKLEKN